MTTDVEILSEMLDESALVKQRYSNNESMIELTESIGIGAKYTVSIKNPPSDALVIKADSFRVVARFFKCENDECKRADFVIISAKKKKIIYIELKRGKDKWNKIVSQLRGAYCLIRYCQSIGMEFWGKTDFLDDYDNRYIIIRRISISKRETRITKDTESNDSPEKAMKIDWPGDIQFDQIAE